MILTRSPLRITLGGGGTDFPDYYREHGGFVVTAAINKYVYTAIHENFDKGLIVKYSEVERCRFVSEIKHPIVGAVIGFANVHADLEIVSMADVPAGTGLGSSGAFTAALTAAIYGYRRDDLGKGDLAEQSSHVEMNFAGPAGKQDTYASVFGGLHCFNFTESESYASRLLVSEETLHNLQDGLMLFFTGEKRSASAVLSNHRPSVDALHQSKVWGIASRDALEAGDLPRFAAILDESWQAKRKTLSTPEIDEMYCLGKHNGAMAGKLVGAGKGGFMMFYTDNRPRLRRAMLEADYRELPFAFDFGGTTRVI